MTSGGDLSKRLPPNQVLAAPGKWPAVGERAPRDSDEPWQVSVTGLVEMECTFALEDLGAIPQVRRTLDLHCVTRWSKFAPRRHDPGGLLADQIQGA